MEYALSANGKLRKVFLVHGEEKPALILQSKLKDNGMRPVDYPDAYQRGVVNRTIDFARFFRL